MIDTPKNAELKASPLREKLTLKTTMENLLCRTLEAEDNARQLVSILRILDNKNDHIIPELFCGTDKRGPTSDDEDRMSLLEKQEHLNMRLNCANGVTVACIRAIMETLT